MLNRPSGPCHDFTNMSLFTSQCHDGHQIFSPITLYTQVLPRPQEGVSPAQFRVFPGDGGSGLLLVLAPLPGQAGLACFPKYILIQNCSVSATAEHNMIVSSRGPMALITACSFLNYCIKCIALYCLLLLEKCFSCFHIGVHYFANIDLLFYICTE